MRLLMLDDNYPSPDNLYSDVFAHVRAKEYAKEHDVTVLSSFSKEGAAYDFEGIKVHPCGSIDNIMSNIDLIKPDIILIHFATIPLIKDIILKNNYNYVIWVHGFEVTGWYRRLYDYSSIIHFLKYIKGNVIQRHYFRKLIRKSNELGNISFVFVSQWIRHIAEKDCGAKPLNSCVIPNPIDDKAFPYVKKPEIDRFKILLLRPFGGRKYATDIMTKSIDELSRRGVLDRFTFDVRGSGCRSSELHKKYKDFSNFRFDDKFLNHGSIKEIHKDSGVIFAISRQDTHGVSACEGMSSGLVPISSYNSAIPEYMTHNVSAILTDNNPIEIADALCNLADNPAKFARLSSEAAREVRRTSSIDSVIRRELDYIIGGAL